MVASVLHLGEIRFQDNGKDQTRVTTSAPIEAISSLLGIDTDVLKSAFSHQTIVARGQVIKGDLNFEQGQYARDAIAKVRRGISSFLIRTNFCDMVNMNPKNVPCSLSLLSKTTIISRSMIACSRGWFVASIGLWWRG